MLKNSYLQELLDAEIARQTDGLELIPSENYVSSDVLEALGSVYTNKYSEGYPGRRYYGGQENTDRVEQYAIDTAKALFGADHANVQPHSGAQANEVVYHAWLQPGDTVLAMDLNHGGHLTHGHPVTVLARQYNFIRYGMKDIETGEIDYDQLRDLAKKHRPKIILAGFSAYPRELEYDKFAEIGREVDAVLMADMAHIAGLIAGKALANPFEHGFHVITSTTHKTLRGPRGGLILTQGNVGNPLKAPEKTLANLPTIIDRTLFPGVQGGPHMHSVFAKAVAFDEASRPEFRTYAQNVIINARTLADELMQRGLKLITNGTDNHLILADVYSSFGIDGKVAEEALDAVGLTVNKNAIAGDTLPPFRPSGIRLGTPAITTRGFGVEDMPQLATWMITVLQNPNDEAILKRVRDEVRELAQKHPLPS